MSEPTWHERRARRRAEPAASRSRTAERLAAADGVRQPARRPGRRPPQAAAAGAARGAAADRNRSPVADGAAAEAPTARRRPATDDRPELPDRPIEGRPQSRRGGRAGARCASPQIGDTRPAPEPTPSARAADRDPTAGAGTRRGQRRRRRGGRRSGGRGGGSGRWRAAAPATPVRRGARPTTCPLELDDETLERRRGRERKGRPVGRYLMAVHVRARGHPDRRARGPQPDRALRLAPGRRRQPDPRQHLPRPGAERAARHGGGVRRHRHAEERGALPRRRAVRPRGRRGASGAQPRIEQMLQGQADHRLPGHQEPDRRQGRPPHPGGVAARPVRGAHPEQRRPTASPSACPTTSASACATSSTRSSRPSTASSCAPRPRASPPRSSSATSPRLLRPVGADRRAWPRRSQAPALLYREPDMAVRVIREEFNKRLPRRRHRRPAALRGGPRLRRRRSARRWPTGSSTTTPTDEPLPLFERYHVHEQLHKALDRKVWLPSGGSLIIEHTEALTVIDVNTGKNVGTSNLEETVFRNNLEAAERDRPPAPAARHRRHHRHRLHRHGDPGQPRRRDRRRSATPWPGTRPAPRCSTSPSSAWSR